MLKQQIVTWINFLLFAYILFSPALLDESFLRTIDRYNFKLVMIVAIALTAWGDVMLAILLAIILCIWLININDMHKSKQLSHKVEQDYLMLRTQAMAMPSPPVPLPSTKSARVRANAVGGVETGNWMLTDIVNQHSYQLNKPLGDLESNIQGNQNNFVSGYDTTSLSTLAMF